MTEPLPSRRSVHRRAAPNRHAASGETAAQHLEEASSLDPALPLRGPQDDKGRLRGPQDDKGRLRGPQDDKGRLREVAVLPLPDSRHAAGGETAAQHLEEASSLDPALPLRGPQDDKGLTAPSLAELQERARAQHAPPPDADAIVECHGLVRIFQSEGVEVVALQGLDLTVRRGELIAIVGASGSGKSTLLNILSGLDAPTAGAVTVAGQNLVTMTPAQRLAYRRSTVGFVFQQTAANLLPYLTAADNVEVPLRATGMKPKARAARAAELLDVLGIGEYADRLPSQLSGGQQQRVAIAVALANNPELILADEPTGELDSATAADVYNAFAQVNAQLGVTVIIVTHDQAVASQVDRTVAIRDGRTSSETLRTSVEDDNAADGAPAERITQEYAVLDRAGRLQLPHDLVEALGLRQRVRLELADDHIRIYPGDAPASGSRSHWSVEALETTNGPLGVSTDAPPSVVLLNRPDSPGATQ